MHLKHNYFYFKEALTPETCKKIRELGENSILEYATTFGENTKQDLPSASGSGEKTIQELHGKKTYIRDSKVSWLNDKWLYDTIVPFIKEANARAGWNWQFDTFEDFQFTIYDKDGFYGWHQDGSSDHFGKNKRYIYGITPIPLNKKGRPPEGYISDDKLVGKVRKISVTINLNEPGEYEGGNLKFDFGNHADKKFHEVTEIRPQGSMVIFPSFLPHCVTPVTKGTRFSLVLWCLGEPWK